MRKTAVLILLVFCALIFTVPFLALSAERKLLAPDTPDSEIKYYNLKSRVFVTRKSQFMSIRLSFAVLAGISSVTGSGPRSSLVDVRGGRARLSRLARQSEELGLNGQVPRV